MKQKLLVALLFTQLLLSLWAIPQMMNYQGILKDDGNQPVPDGQYPVSFALYGAESGGNALWTENQMVSTINGVFLVQLGSVNGITSFPSENAWLSIRIGNNPEMVPRKRIASVGYSLSSQTAMYAYLAETSNTANSLQGYTANDFVQVGTIPGIISALATPVSVTIPQAGVWNEMRALTVTISSPMILSCHGFFRRGTAGGPFAAQLILTNQSGQVIDYGDRSWRNPSNVNHLLDLEIFFTVNPGTYTVKMLASFDGEPGVAQDAYLELLGFPQSPQRFEASDTSSGINCVYPYTQGPLRQP